MAQTITPVVHGGSRRKWAGAVALHVTGASASAAAVGALLGAGGSLLGTPWGRAGMLAVAAIALAYAGREIAGLPVPLIEMRRQVPEWWRGAFGPRMTAFLYGVALGPGFFTHLRHGTFVAVAAAAVMLGSPAIGVALVVPFGVARSLGVALASAARTEPAALAAGDRLERLGSGSLPRIANGVALVSLAVAAAFTSAPSGSPEPWLWPAILALTFAWASLAKLLRPGAWMTSLHAHALPGWLERTAEKAVPMAEASVALILLFGHVRAGAGLALLLLAAFTLALIRARARGSGALPCGCFGGRSSRSVSWLLARNMILGLIGVAALVVGSPLRIEAPGLEDAVPGLLAVIGIGLAAWLLRRSADNWSVQPRG